MSKLVRGQNHFEATCLLDLLLQAGINQYYVSPGSRSTPLVEALADRPEAISIVHFDERGAAFAALGYARATGRAAALICTSGTAVANYFPAVIEASQSGISLLVISADRPLEAIGTGANQTIDQRAIFGKFVRASLDFEKVDLLFEHRALENVLSCLVDGPVHLNFRFTKPLLAKEIPGPVFKKIDLQAQNRAINALDIDHLKQRWAESRNPLIVVGQFDRPNNIEKIFAELSELKTPVIATALSGLRAFSRHSENFLFHYEFYIEQLQSSPPDLVLHLGRAQPSIALDAYLEHLKIPTIVVDDSAENYDPYGSVLLQIQADPAALLSQLKLVAKASAFGETAKIFEARAKLAIERESKKSDLSEWGLASLIAEETKADTGLFLSSSLPVRTLDACLTGHAVRMRLASNRGVSGIDGTVATAVGFCQGLNQPTTLVIGDLALLHDLNSLALVKTVPLIIVAINNNGGGIFELLPIRREVSSERFEKFWGTPHGLGFEYAAKLFGLRYQQVRTREEFLEAYRLHRGSPALIEFVCDRADTATAFKRIKQEALGTPIVFLHGYLGSPDDFKAVIQQMPGTYCLSLALPTEAGDFETAALKIREELLQRGITRAVIAGQSLGGRLALCFARKFPEMIEKLILMGAHPGLEDEKDRANRWESDQKTASDLQNSSPEDFLKRWYEQPIFSSLAKRPEVLRDLISRRAGYTPKNAADVLLKFSLAKQTPGWDILESLRERLVYIAGELDEKFVAIGKEISRRVPKAEVVTIKNSGHAIYAEEPVALALALQK